MAVVACLICINKLRVENKNFKTIIEFRFNKYRIDTFFTPKNFKQLLAFVALLQNVEQNFKKNCI